MLRKDFLHAAESQSLGHQAKGPRAVARLGGRPTGLQLSRFALKTSKIVTEEQMINIPA